MSEFFLSHETLAVIAIILTLAGYFQYFRTMFAGKTKPHMFSWLIWATLTAIAYFAQVSDGAGPGSWVTGLSAGISFFIAGYAFFYGEKTITRGDWLTFIAAIAAIPVWLITDNPLWSVIIITIIDALGFYPTFRKSWMKPYDETMFHYIMAGTKFILATMALSNVTIITALYPLSLVLMNFVFVALLIVRRRALQKSTVDN